MKKLTYWCCEKVAGAQCYNIRAKTKAEALRLKNSCYRPNDFSKPFKVVVEYRDSFELMMHAMSEGSIYERAKKKTAKKIDVILEELHELSD